MTGLRFALVGGAGRVGRWLARGLRDRGHRVLVLDRAAGEGVDVVVDALDHDPLQRALASSDVVVHLAAVVPRAIDRHDPAVVARAWSTNVGSVATTLHAAHACGIDTVVHMSSMGVFTDYGSTPVPEGAEPDAMTTYGLSKRVAERLCSMLAEPLGLSVTSLRLAYPTSPEAWPLWVLPQDESPVALTMADGTPVQATPPGDVVDAVLAALGTAVGHHVDVVAHDRTPLGAPVPARHS